MEANKLRRLIILCAILVLCQCQTTPEPPKEGRLHTGTVALTRSNDSSAPEDFVLNDSSFSRNSFASCAYEDKGKVSACVEIIMPDKPSYEDFASNCRKGHGKINPELCELRNAFGKCLTRKGFAHDVSFIHYDPNSIEKRDKIKRSCELAHGTWEPFDIRKALYDEVRIAEESTHFKTADFSLTWNALGESMIEIARKLADAGMEALRPLSRAPPESWLEEMLSATNDENRWTQIGFFRDLWQAMYWQGGCGSLSTASCAKALGADVTLADAQSHFNSSKTHAVQRERYLEDMGYCGDWGLKFENDCETYGHLKNLLDNNAEVSVTMSLDGNGHVEHLYKAINSPSLGCYGITNSWGNPAWIEGGYGAFFHSLLEDFRGPVAVNYEVYSNCTKAFCTEFECNDANKKTEAALAYPLTATKSRSLIQKVAEGEVFKGEAYLSAIINRTRHLLNREKNPLDLDLALELLYYFERQQRVAVDKKALFLLAKHRRVEKVILNKCPNRGSYLESCAVLECRNDKISALCPMEKGDYLQSQSLNCNGDLVNENGTLKCKS